MTDNANQQDLRSALHRAKSKYEISAALDAISQSDEAFPMDPFIEECLGDSRWLVRHSAISAVAQCSGVDAEHLLLRLAEDSSDPYDLHYINCALGTVGTERSFEYLTAATRHKDTEVACTALAALEAIGSADHLPVFMTALADRRWQLKWFAMTGIRKHGDASAVDPVLNRVKRILGTKRGTPQYPESELTVALDFLWRFRNTEAQLAAFFDKFLPARLHKLNDDEQADLARIRSQS